MIAIQMTGMHKDRDIKHFVHPQTVIYTKRGPKYLKDVTLADHVYTKADKFVRVKQVLKQEYVGRLVNVDGRGYVGESHQLLVIEGSEIFFKPAIEIKINDKLLSISPTECEDIEELTEDDCVMYGALFSGAQYNDDGTATMSYNKLVMFAADYLKRHGLLISVSKDKNFTIKFKLPFNKATLVDGKGNKIIFKDLLNLPREKCEAVREGVWHAKNADMTIANKIIAHSMRFMWLKTGFDMIFRENNMWNDDEPETPMEGKWIATPVHSMSTQMYQGNLYDLETEGENEDERTYQTDLGISHNGGGKRNGSFAMYIEPWHADIFDFLDLKKNHGDEERRARDLFYALWVPDLFYERVQKDGKWSLMDPNKCRGLADAVGADFKSLYEKYEAEGSFAKQIDARELWNHILTSQVETGTPYLLNKDAANRKSNQSNLGTIRSSNLCAEIIEYSDANQHAVCNLASICLPMYVAADGFDFDKLHSVVKVVTRNLNKVIDVNYYPTPEAEFSNKQHRPIGIGVQGLADVFAILKLPFESEEARRLNRDIAETIYHAALETSSELAGERESDILEYKQLASIEEKGKDIKKQINAILKRTQFSQEELTRRHCAGAYDSYFWNGGCPVSKNILQFDMWNEKPSDRWKWDSLRDQIENHGIRNSLLVAYMPTASTSQIMGNMESFEPFTANIYSRRTIAGEFIVVNKYLMRDLIEAGLWNEELKQKILAHEGSVQNIPEIPERLKNVYKTVWEIKQKSLIDMSADRGAFTCQSQSLNLYCATPTPKVLTSMHFYSWAGGGPRSLKTAVYYLRCTTKAKMQPFTIDPSVLKQKRVDSASSAFKTPPEEEIAVCRRDNPECLACGS